MKFDTVQDKVIVLTGASSGIGKGVALSLAEQGAYLLLAARRDNLLEALAQECHAIGGRAIAVPTDVSKKEDIENLAQTAIREFGRIDVWINNAGVAALGRFDEVSLEDHLQVIQTDLVGMLQGSYYAFQQFRSQNAGTLINVSSVIGKIPAPYYTSYAAAKFGVVGFSAALRQEITQTKMENLHVCTVLPMATDTTFFEHAANVTGQESVPIPPTYDAKDVIETIVNLITNPQPEVVVGTAGKVFTTLHNLAPGLIEHIMGKETHTVQIDKAAPQDPTEGSLREPVSAGTTISGGWK